MQGAFCGLPRVQRRRLTASVTKTTSGASTTTSYAYDDAGNRTSRTTGGTTDSYQWDAEGELASDDDYQYVYDANGTRIVRDGTDGTTVYLPGGQELTITGTAVSAARYYTFGGQTIATRTSKGLSGVTSLVTDRDGSVVAAVPNTTWTTSSLKRVYSDPFGAVRGSTDAGVPGDHRFLGAPRDAASGLTLLGARYYDPVAGCFISVDPVLNVEVPAHLNAYVYGFNNPASFSDPSGLEPKDKNGNYDGTYYGGGSGSSPAPPSTSWAALASCAEVACNFQWAASFGLNYYGGMADVIGDLLWMTCGFCAAVSSTRDAIAAFSDLDAYFAQQQAKTQAFQEFWSDPWGNFWRPIGDDWANNPGHALGATVAIVGTSAIPGGGLLKGGSAAAKAAGVTEDVARVGAIAPYARPSGATTAAQRASVQGLPCVDCGMIGPTQVADHIDPLVVQYYRDGAIDLDQMKSVTAVQPQCSQCSASQGGRLSWYSRTMKETLSER